MRNLRYIEVFAGAGGLSEGFIQEGFQPVALIEKDKYATLTLKTRLAYHWLKENNKIDIYKEYIRGNINRKQFYSCIPEEVISSVVGEEITKNNIKAICCRIEKCISNNRRGRSGVDILLGGPPCQTYSLIGRVRRQYGGEKDPRSYLYKLYVRLLEEFRPQVFVFENVPGLLSAGKGSLWKTIQEYFMKAGYDVDCRVLNAYDFGVLQNRKRIIIIGWRRGVAFRYPHFNKEQGIEAYKVSDVLNDLPPLRPGERMTTGEYVNDPSQYLRKYGIRDKDDILTLHMARNHNERDRAIYKLCIQTWKQYRRRLKYDELPDSLKTHRNTKIFVDRYKVVAPDLPYSQTMMAHLSKDGHYFIHPDQHQLRSISVREAARFQSFPDNFYFEGPMLQIFKQIGNAVPPLMATKIAAEIRKMIV